MSRRAKVSINYAKTNKSASILEFASGFSYVDNATGESDTISLTLGNSDLRFLDSWKPKKGDKVTANVELLDWQKDCDKKKISCGKFCVDNLKYAGPTLTCDIGATSVPETSSFRATARSKTWKSVTVKEIAKKITERYKMKFYYDAETIKIKSVEQSNADDCNFLCTLCESYGLGMKIYAGKVIIYDRGRYEKKKSVETLKAEDLLDWNYDTNLTGLYTGATIKYPGSNKDTEMTCKVGSGSRILTISDTAVNLYDAERKAYARINTENEGATTLSATIMANLKIVATSCIKISGLKSMDGKYFVDKVTHNLDSTYTMNLEMHRCQNRLPKNNKYTSTSYVSSSSTSSSDSTKANKVVTTAKSYTGKVKYVFGASNPDGGKSDCSGFSRHVYKKAAGIDIGRNTDAQVRKGTQVSKSDLEIGDLVFFKNTYRSHYIYGVSHVGIYVGDGKFIHCHSTGVSISKLSESYYSKHWLMGRRVLTQSKSKSSISKSSVSGATSTEIKLLAAVCFLEAGTNYQGCLAVANVILNRKKNKSYPNTIKAVIYQKSQFSTAKNIGKVIEHPYSNCLKAVKAALNGSNNVGGRLSFRSASYAKGKHYKNSVNIGGNVFF